MGDERKPRSVDTLRIVADPGRRRRPGRPFVCRTCHRAYPAGRLICPLDSDVLLDPGERHPMTGKIVGGRYRLGKLLGEGGMGLVFEAAPVDLPEGADRRRNVALKIQKSLGVDHHLLDRFRREAEIATAVGHPGVVRVIESCGDDPEGAFLVMERLWGPTLDELRESGKLESVETTVSLLVGVAEVVSAAHEKGIIHRDLKPSNVIQHRPRGGHDLIKVLDFGVARHPGLERITATHEYLGTTAYMAPELFGGTPASTASDVYALGVLLFETLTGRRPYEASEVQELVWKHATEPAPRASRFAAGISPGLDDVISRALGKRPEHRYPDAAALRDALMEQLAGGESLVRTLGSARHAGRWVGTTLDGTYRIEEWLGPGRFGSLVFHATHLRMGTSVALRLWPTERRAEHREMVELFRREAQANRVQHPGLIPVLDVAWTDDAVYLVSAFVESESLRALLDREGPLAEERATGLIASALEALGALHDAGQVSGGFSPETIRLTRQDGREALLLSPWGLESFSELRDILATAPDEEHTGDALRYMAPEQTRDAAPDVRSDLYSLALIYLEMLRGPEAIEAPADGESARAAGVPAWQPIFFARALAADPADRFADAQQMLDALPVR